MRSRTKGIVLKLAGIAIACGIVAYSFVPEVRWRADVLVLMATGQIEDISYAELIPKLIPGNPFYVENIGDSLSPHSVIFNPYTSREDIDQGQRYYEEHCSKCHGTRGEGEIGPALNVGQFSTGDSDWALYRAISSGISGTAMPGTPLEENDVWKVIAFVRDLQYGQSLVEPEKVEDFEPVSEEQLRSSRAHPDSWLTYSGAFDSQRFSTLDQINNNNAASVSIEWVYQFKGDHPIQETSPIVVGSTMYITEAPNIVHAIDARTGISIWSYSHENDPGLVLCCGQVNRGVAVHGDTIFMGTLDSSLVALDARTGELKWSRKLADHTLGSSVTSAPLVVEDKVIVGYGGGDMGLRGFVDAVNVEDGSTAWRVYTVPGPGEVGNDTWSGDSWKTGGAATWLTGSYDPDNGLLYWTTGNPAPDFNGDERLGDNLYSCSVLAIDLATGELKWHFQFTPHDEHDWDSNQIPVLVDREWNGEQRRLLLLANRNGFFYVLDRDTGEFLLAKAFAEQNWALEIDENGRPVLNPDTILTEDGRVTWPSLFGATNWQSPSYSPLTDFFYVAAMEHGNIFFKNAEPPEFEQGFEFMGGGRRPIPGNPDMSFMVRAIDPDSGDIAWEYKHPDRQLWGKTGGLLSTAGQIIFGGDNTDIFILDARDGTELWRRNVGGWVNSAPVSFQVDGKQRLTVASGRSLITLSLP